MPYLATVFIIGLIILIHEAGHLFAARAAGIPIERFSIGFGPALVKISRGGTEYRFCVIPIGGYVLPAVKDEQEFFAITPGRRLILSLGGPAANIAGAIVLFAAYNTVTGGASLDGILVRPFAQTINLIVQFTGALAGLFSKHNELAGIIGIVSQGGSFIQADASRVIAFAALLNLNLGFFNMLPVPALDGGKALLNLFEMMLPGTKRLQAPLAIAGWVLMLGLLAYATALDIGRMIS